MSLMSFPKHFMSNYTRLTQFQVDPGMWLWDTNESLFSMFDALYKSLASKNPQTGYLLNLCSVYGPWSIPVSLLHGFEFHENQDTLEGINSGSELQSLVDNEVELNMAIHEIYRLFLAKKLKNADGELMSIALHASLCQWRLASMGEERAGWIMQASHGLAKHIKSQDSRKG